MYLMRIGAPGAEKPVARLSTSEHLRRRLRRGRATSTRRSSAAAASTALAPVVGGVPARARCTPLGDERVGAPIARPHQILCIGLNYRDHAAETGQAVPDEPILFTKSPNTLVGPVRRRAHPARLDQDRLGGRARHRHRHGATSYLDSVDEARDAIAGYVAGQRRQRAGLPDGARRPVVEGQVGRDVQPGRSLAGHPGRDRRRARAGHVAGRQRRRAGRPASPRRWSSTRTSSCTTSASSWCWSRAT